MYNDVYEYWFSSQPNNQLRHWIPITSTEKKKKLNEIESKFIDIYFINLFKILSTLNLNFTLNFSFKEKLAVIILLDQFTRTLSAKYERIQKFKLICSKLAFYYTNNDFIINKIYLDLYPDELLFVLMIYKHLDYKFFSLINTIITNYCYYNKYLLTETNCINLQKFYIDFYKKYIFNTDIIDERLIITSCKSGYEINNFKHLFNQDGFLPENFEKIDYHFTNFNDLNCLDKNVYEKLKVLNIKEDICISLSGGVDSMVLTFILKKIEIFLKNKSNNIKVKAFHLSYNNRKESIDEKKFLEYFCKKINVPLYHFNIPYITRDSINRKNYEQITRDIRFACYFKMKCPIILGHIYEDQVENIFTNISNNKHIFNLSKMQLKETIQNILILRLFIDIKKDNIYKYAHDFNVPYFNDTTPLWSNRGKFRKKFINEFIEQYDQKGVENLVKISNTLKNYGNLINETIINPMIHNLIVQKYIIIPQSMMNNSHLLKELFTQYCHLLNYSMPSDKSIKGLIEVLKKKKKQKYPLTDKVKLLINNNKINIL